MNGSNIQFQDYRHLTWTLNRRSSGTAGSFLKAFDETPHGKRYYKLSNYDPFHGIIGHECVNELIADRLLGLFRIPHLHYELIPARVEIDGHEYETWLCRSADFKITGERKLALDVFYQLERLDGESPLDFCRRFGWGTYIDQMLFIDYLILNRDRHGANIEILQNRETRSIRPAPLFDHGLSLLCSCRDKQSLVSFDVMEDRPVQSFVGSHSAAENLHFISDSFWKTIPTLHETDLEKILCGLTAALSRTHLEKIREMIWRRWNSLESLRDS